MPSVPGYFEAASHSGITLGPVIGRLLASEILRGKRDETLADFPGAVLPALARDTQNALRDAVA